MIFAMLLLCSIDGFLDIDSGPTAALPMPVAIVVDSEPAETTPPETATCQTGLCRVRESADPDTYAGKSEVRPAPATRRFQPLRNLFRGRRV